MINLTEQSLQEAENEGQNQQYFTTEEGGGLIAVGVRRGVSECESRGEEQTLQSRQREVPMLSPLIS